MNHVTIKVQNVVRPLVRPFIISTGARTHQPVLRVSVSDGVYAGRGEATGVRYKGETTDTMVAQIEALNFDTGLSRNELIDRLPAGGARAALDAALWELEAAQAGTTVAAILGADPHPVASAFTIVLDTPDAMAVQTKEEAWRPLLKVKLGGSAEDEADRIRAVRSAAPHARLVIDANAGWTADQLLELAPLTAELGYELIEQPLPMGCEDRSDMRDALLKAGTILPLCADESFQTLDDFDHCASLYRFINIKLDKCGGLTSALTIKAAAEAKGVGVFIGCMLAPTIAIAPAHVLAQTADYADLDGPFWFPGEPAKMTDEGLFSSIPSRVWGEGIGHADD